MSSNCATEGTLFTIFIEIKDDLNIKDKINATKETDDEKIINV